MLIKFERDHRKIGRLGMLFTILLLTAGCQSFSNPPLIAQIHPDPDPTLSAYGWVGVAFSQPMEPESVENAFFISPEVKGEFLWQDTTLWFRPIHPFAQDTTYQARLSGDLLTTSSEAIPVDKSWSFSVRQPALIYYVPMGESGEIWRLSPEDGSPFQLSQTGGQVLEFAVERSGEKIAFTVKNDSGGKDLWYMDRDGNNQQRLLECGQDQCSEPAWSMDTAWIAYTREVFNPEIGGYSPAQIWTVDVDSGETQALYQSEFAFGHSPAFSPDGKRLATYDTTQKAIRILELSTSQESAIPRTLSGSGDWSPDGKQILFTDVLPAENEPFVEIYRLDLESQNIQFALGEASTDTDFSQPRWSPDGNWIAVSLRPVNTGISRALWVLSLHGLNPILVDGDPSATFSAYQWDPWGENLVYQRTEFSSSGVDVSIWRWNWKTRQRELLIENGARPLWLP